MVAILIMTTAPLHPSRATDPAATPACPNCLGTRIACIERLWHEWVRAQPVRYRCRDCERAFIRDGKGQTVLLPKRTVYCWRCGGDIDRRRARNGLDTLMRILG